MFGHRQLKNTVLRYLAKLEDQDVMELVKTQYQTAENMTDKISALNILADSNSDYRAEALADFYNQWKDDAVVINKWFAAQAVTSRPQIIEDIKALIQHPAFNIANPNNVYSLLRNFGGHITKFYDPTLNAFEFYADKIIEIDKLNPQVAARLCSAFNYVQKLDPFMKEKALTQIKRIVAVPELSKNSRELLQSSL